MPASPSDLLAKWGWKESIPVVQTQYSFQTCKKGLGSSSKSRDWHLKLLDQTLNCSTTEDEIFKSLTPPTTGARRRVEVSSCDESDEEFLKKVKKRKKSKK